MSDPRPSPPRRLGLRANFSWTLLGNAVYSGCQWGMIVLLAKLSSTAAVGRYAYGLALAAPIFMFAGLNLRGVQATDARERYGPGAYLALRLVASALALAVLGALSAFVSPDPETRRVVLAIGVAKAVEALSDVLYGTMQRHERMDLIGRSMILKGLLSLAAFGGALLVSRDVFWATAALGASWAATLLAYDAPVAARLAGAGAGAARALRPEWRAATLRALARTAAPLGLVALLISLNANVPRYFLEHHAGVDDLGLFAALTYLMVAGGTVVGALGQAASARLAIVYASGGLQAFRALLARLLAVAAVIGAGGVLVALVAGQPLLSLLYRPEYGLQAPVFTWIAVASAVSFLASMLGYAMTAAQLFDAQAFLFAAVSAATAAASFWLVPRYGLHGAALALVAGNAVQLAGAAALIARRLASARAAGAPAQGPVAEGAGAARGGPAR